jgi:hypothetical protein
MKQLIQKIARQRLPSVIGIAFLSISLITITWLSRNVILFGTKAATAAIPNAVQVTNISDTSFTISYLTEEKVTGTISYGKEQTQGSIAMDDRDKQTATPIPHRVHHITIKDVTPKTPYFFTIISDDKTFDNNGKPYTITTAPTLTDSLIPEQPLTGTIMYQNGSIPTEGIVFAGTSTSQLRSVLVQPDGSYEIPLSPLYTKDLTSYESLTQNSTFQLVITDASTESTASFRLNQTRQIPAITLSQNYDFSATEPTIVASPSASIVVPAFPTTAEPVNNEPQILTPTNNQTFTDQQPLFRGTAPPNETVTITINSETAMTATVKVNGTGTWEYRPEKPLDPGEHTITVNAFDLSGVAKKITQSFTVFAEGSQFVEPSISPSVSPTEKQTPTPTKIISPKLTMTPTASPTATIEPTATIIPTQMIASTSGTIRPTVQPTGSTSAITALIGIITSIGIGALLFFLTAV